MPDLNPPSTPHRRTPYQRAPDLARLPIVMNPGAISLAEGVRAGLSVAVIIALHEILGRPLLTEAALAALLTCLADPGGPIRRRAPFMLGFAVVGACLTCLGGLARARGIEVAVPVGIGLLFVLSFLRIYGQRGQQFGTLASIALILSLDHALPGLETALPPAIAFLGGSVWAVVLTLVIWPVHPFGPARAAVSQAYTLLAGLAGDMHRLVMAPATDAAAWDRQARTHRRPIRDAIEAAREVVLQTLRARGSGSLRATQSLIRVETGEQIFGTLIALASHLEQIPPSARPVAAALLERVQPLLTELARSIADDTPPGDLRAQDAISALQATTAQLPADDPLVGLASRLAERLRIAATLSEPRDFAPAVTAEGQSVPLWRRAVAPLSANLTWRSDTLRHACRIALMAGGALAVTLHWPTPFGHWLTITLVGTLQPVFALTFTRAIERVAGTLAGGLVGAAVGMVCTTQLSLAIAMFPLSVAALALRQVSYGLFTAAMTPLIIVLVEVSHTMTEQWVVAGERAALTALGGAIAIAANFLLWPQRRSAVLAETAAIAAHGAWATTELARLLGERGLVEVIRARRAAGLASNALEAGLNQALIERRKDERDRLNALLVVDAALRRVAGCILALQFDRDLPPPEAIRAWSTWIAAATRVLTAGGTALPARPDHPASATLLRLARQLELIAGATATPV